MGEESFSRDDLPEEIRSQLGKAAELSSMDDSVLSIVKDKGAASADEILVALYLRTKNKDLKKSAIHRATSRLTKKDLLCSVARGVYSVVERAEEVEEVDEGDGF